MFHFSGISLNHPAGPELMLWHYIAVSKWQYKWFFSSQEDTCKYILPFSSTFWNATQDFIYLVHIAQSWADPLQNVTINNCYFHCRSLLPTKSCAAPASTRLCSDAAIPGWKLANENTGEQEGTEGFFRAWGSRLLWTANRELSSSLIMPVGKTLTF